MVWIYGEISNYRSPSSGHAYFSLKDDKAQIGAVMFRGQLQQLKFRLDNGITIVGLGRISVYEPRGTYQIILEYVEPQGVGALQIAFEKLKRQLADEGLFDADHKTPLPFLPAKIGVLTSPTGAVIQDILHILNRRFSNIPVVIFPVRVQGDGAADEIVRAIAVANQQADIEILILARGGGSLEDLAAFNSESVARAIFASVIPVVAAIGHETDYTIADFVADLRAPTPSAAAEMVVPVKSEVQTRCTGLQLRCKRAMDQILERQHRHLGQTRRRLIHPRHQMQALQLRTDDLLQRLQRAHKALFQNRTVLFENYAKRLLLLKPYNSVLKYRSLVDVKRNNLLQSIKIKLIKSKETLAALDAALYAMSPQAVLQRGYSITRTLPHGRIITQAETVSPNQSLEILLAQGRLVVAVTRKSNAASLSLNQPHDTVDVKEAQKEAKDDQTHI